MMARKYPRWVHFTPLDRYWMQIPKCGSQTLKRMIDGTTRAPDVPEDQVNFDTSFCVVRPPLERLQAVFMRGLVHSKLWGRYTNIAPECWDANGKHPLLTPDVFARAVRDICATPDEDLDEHLASQAYLISKAKHVANVIRLETLPYTPQNVGPSAKVQYTPELERMAAERFSADTAIYAKAITWEDMC